jgi:ATP-binding cassette subfamily C protein
VGTVGECRRGPRSHEAEPEAERLWRKATYERTIRREALGQLAGVLDGPPAVPPAHPAADPLLGACQLVGNALGNAIVHPPRSYRDGRDPLGAIAKASRIRVRRVTLTSDWWRHENGPLLAFTLQDRRPVALLPAGGRSGLGLISSPGYQLVDPDDGTRRRVSRPVADELTPDAWAFYRPLPVHALSVRELLGFGLRGCGADLLRLVLMGAAGGMLALVVPIASGLIFGSLIPRAEQDQLVQLALVLMVAAVAGALFQLGRGIALLRLETRIDASLQAAVWDRLLRLPASFFRDYSAGDLATRAMAVEMIRQIVTGATVSAIFSAAFSLCSFALLFFYDVALAMTATALTGIVLAAMVVATCLQLRYQRMLSALQGQISGLVLQLLVGIAKLRVAGAENRAFAVWAKAFAAQKRLDVRAQSIANVVVIFSSSWPIITSMAIFGMVAWSHGTAISTGSFLAFLAAFTLFLTSALGVAGALTSLLEAVPLFEQAKPIFETLPEVDVAKADPGLLGGAIELNNVAFRYETDGPLILHDVSLHVEPGQFIALVGPSGAGKSSLFRLLLGFERPEAGSVYYDGRDLAGLDVEAVRHQIGVVMQSGRLLPGSVFQNIVGSSLLTLDDAWEAARLAGLDGDIRRMPMGMQTYISEGGATFSGGQKQRLLIAQAIASKPRILLFDEATSALDNHTQAIVSDSLARLQATRIAIAHRLSTIEHADRIFVLQGGRIVQQGTYAELIAVPGPFAELARRQLA